MVKLTEIGFRKPYDPFMHDDPMPQAGDIVTNNDGKQGQVLNTPLWLKRQKFVRVIFDGKERAIKVQSDQLTVIKPHNPL